MKTISYGHTPMQRQRGAALIVSLLLLLIMTLLGVSAMQTTTLQERMAGNTRDRAVALQAAEYALRDAETVIDGLSDTGTFTGTNGLYGETDAAPDPGAPATWSTGGNITVTTSGTMAVSSTQPRYYIKLSESDILVQDFGDINKNVYATVFEIVTRGVGGNQNTEVILRSHYGRVM
ncbi:MAG TPA: PilX N-terminal domain-containing pilus assembly protein [Thiohalobacter sp.]|nr:PilX N-terminal domain-containing pilus assembly protein [Thiohalobacter sp.]